MNWLLRFGWLVGLLAGTLPLGAQGVAPLRSTVVRIEIRHVGPPAVSDDLIRANIRTRVGDAFSVQRTDQDVRSLQATGFFSNVRVATEPEADGLKVIYLLTGKPVLTEIRFDGNRRFSDRKLRRQVKSKVGEPLNEFQLHAAAQEMQKAYQKAGFQRTRVEPKVVINEELGRGVATFVVDEAPRVRLVDVEFAGAEAFKQSRLRRVLKTRRWWMFSWLTGTGRLKEEQFQEDQERLREFYQNAGYIDIEIRQLELLEPEPNRMVIRFHLFEGTQYRVGQVEFRGNEAFSDEEIRRGLVVLGVSVRPRMLEDEVFTPRGLDDDQRAIEDFYGARGYIGRGDADRVRVRAIRIPNVETGTMDLTYEIEEGDPSRIERIDIRGNTKTRDRVIRRELAVTPGETFNMVRVKISRQRLEGLGFLERVETGVDPVEGVPDARDLVISVTEGQSGSYFMGAGFSTIESIFGYVGLTQSNFDLFNPPTFTGAGQRLRIQLTIGTRQQNIELRFVEPWFLGRRLMFELDAFHRNLQYLSDLYDQRETGARAGLVRELFPGIRGGISYTLQDTTIDFRDASTRTNVVVNPLPGGGREAVVVPPRVSPELAQEQGSWLISKVGMSLVLDRRGPGFLPERGHKQELLFQLGGGPFGGDTDFAKWEFRSAWYFPGLARGHVLELGGRTGAVEAYGRSDRVHIWDRFYLGGAYTLRGYGFRDIGPRDSLGEPIGGNTSWMVSAEYSIPIIERVRLAGFYDAGAVNAAAYDYGTANFADSAGMGIRINIPQIGPLRLDYAFPITHPDYVGSSGRFQFSVGYERPL
jgi:outer membrane protein insertion porin family